MRRVNGSFPITVSAISGTVTKAIISDTPSNSWVRLAVTNALDRKRTGASSGCKVRLSTSTRAAADTTPGARTMKGVAEERANRPWRDRAREKVTRAAVSNAPPM